jgi:enoyl-CoA hydratase/carnithine racemase
MAKVLDEKVLYEQRGEIALITLNRPDVRNAVDQETAEGLRAALLRADADPGIRAVTLTGAGDVAFCAGVDLKAAPAQQPGFGVAQLARMERAKPLVAAVNGYALGAGFELALLCDLVVAAEEARFGLPEVTVGRIAGAGGLLYLGRRLPRAAANGIALTGRRLTAAEALAMGLVNSVVPRGGVLAAALELAGQVCANAPLAVQESVRLMRAVAGVSEQEAWRLNDEARRRLAGTHDIREGALAFAEKRRPSWTGA